MFDSLERMREALGARHCAHLRFETHHVGGVETAQEWIRQGRVRFLALNDHLPGMARRLGDDRKLLQYANRAECDLDTFQARIRQAMAAADAVADAMRELTACAQAAGLKVAPHDDPDAATRHYYHQLGCGVAEFPLTREAAGVARDLGDAIVFGGPNVARGGSHTNAPNATDMIRAGLCDILTSDYYYPRRWPPRCAWPTTACALAAGLGPDLAQSARAAGLDDRGALAPGLLADAIVVDDRVPGLPRVCATIVGGELRYATGAFLARTTRPPRARRPDRHAARPSLRAVPGAVRSLAGTRQPLARSLRRNGRRPERQPGMPAAAQEWTRAPRHYGPHATLKPPFRLIAGAAPSDVGAAAALAAQHRAFAIELECAPLRGFLAWRLTESDPAGRARIHALADAAVRELDRCAPRPRPRNWPSACAIRWRRPSTRCWSAGATPMCSTSSPSTSP